MLIALNKQRLLQVGEMTVGETPSPGCVDYITGASIHLLVNESPIKVRQELRYFHCKTQKQTG